MIRLEQRDAYGGPPLDLPPINLLWTDPPVGHKTDDAIDKIHSVWGPYLAINGKIIVNGNNPANMTWYDWVEQEVLANSNIGDLVVDPFSGEHTTGKAAIANGRSYYGCDIKLWLP